MSLIYQFYPQSKACSKLKPWKKKPRYITYNPRPKHRKWCKTDEDETSTNCSNSVKTKFLHVRLVSLARKKKMSSGNWYSRVVLQASESCIFKKEKGKKILFCVQLLFALWCSPVKFSIGGSVFQKLTRTRSFLSSWCSDIWKARRGWIFFLHYKI